FAHDAVWRVLAELDGREPGHALDAPSHDVVTFMNEALPPLRARLAATLRPADDDGLACALLLRSGRIQPTTTHVDVHLHLDEARLDVRLAGLDANPGWVPELGRVVGFHYG
ncbi:MAG TPA: hypothetical protein VK928_03690, partial [Longimicrobiales bacterium]|nr:hypothetical protein [Longimicrobiales bacterium]